MAAKKKTAAEGDGKGAAKAGRAAPIPPLEGVDDAVLKKVAAALRKVTPDKLYKASNALTDVGLRRSAVAWHLAAHRAVPLFTLTGQLLDAFQLPPVSADTILDLLPRLRAELPPGPEVPRLPVLGETWRHDEDELLVAAYLLDKDRVRARAAELPTPLALPFVAARFGEPIGADEGRAILGLLGEAIGARAMLLQLPWATDRKEYAWYPANVDDVAGYYDLLRRTFGDTAELDRGVIRGVGKATFRVSADPYLGATSIATPKELQLLWPGIPDQHVPVLTERLLARGEPASFFFAAADAARARVKKGTDDGPTRYTPDAESAFAAVDFYLALGVLASGAREVPATTDGRWTFAEIGETNPERSRLLCRAFARLPRARALAVAERFLVEKNFFYPRAMVVLAAHFDAGAYERVLARCAAEGRAWALVGLPGAAALPQLAAAYDRAAGPLKADLHRGAWEALAESHRAGQEVLAEHDRFIDFFRLGDDALTSSQLTGLGIGEEVRVRDALLSLPEARREAALRRAIAKDQPRPSKPWIWVYTVASDDFLRDALEVVLTSTGTWSSGSDQMVVTGIRNARPRVLPMIAALYPRVSQDPKVKGALQQALSHVELQQMAAAEPPRKGPPSEEPRPAVTVDYAARRRPEIFKPLVDAALSRIAAVGGRTFTPPAAVEPGTGPWGYLDAAVAAGRADLTTPAVANALGEHTWSHRFLLGKLAEHLTAVEAVETEEEAAGDDDGDFFGRPIVLAYYPEESHECLRQGHFVGGGDADVIALWQRADRTSVCHAHMEGFWILGEDPVDFIERIAARAEGKTA